MFQIKFSEYRFESVNSYTAWHVPSSHFVGLSYPSANNTNVFTQTPRVSGATKHVFIPSDQLGFLSQHMLIQASVTLSFWSPKTLNTCSIFTQEAATLHALCLPLMKPPPCYLTGETLIWAQSCCLRNEPPFDFSSMICQTLRCISFVLNELCSFFKEKN